MDFPVKKLVKSISLALVFSFFSEQILFAYPDIQPYAWPASQKPPLTLSFPGSVALTGDFYRAPSSGKTLVLLQDAHTNPSGQLNLSKALDIILQSEKDLKTVFLEAGEGDESLDFLRPFADAEKRASIAETYRMRGEFQGSEYLSFTSERDFELWGVEDMALYRQSLETYRAVAGQREKFQAYLDTVEAAARSLKPRLLNDFLRSFDASAGNYAAGNMALTDYFGVLRSQALRLGIGFDRYPHLRDMNDLQALESAIDFTKARTEEVVAVEALPEADRQELAHASTQPRAPFKLAHDKDAAEKAFFALLEEKIGAEGLPQYPELEKYFRYLKKARAFDAAGVLDELTALEKEVTAGLTLNPDEEMLVRASRNVRTLKKLLDLTLTPDEFSAYKSDAKNFNIDALAGFLNKKIMDTAGFYEKTVFLETGYEEAVRRCEDFYELTRKRDEAFVRNALARMDAKGRQKAVLVTGGYHGPNLRYLLKKAGVSYTTVTPQVYQETNRRRYERLLLNQDLKAAFAVPVSAPAAASENVLKHTLSLTRPLTYDSFASAGTLTAQRFFDLIDRGQAPRMAALRLARRRGQPAKTEIVPAASRLAGLQVIHHVPGQSHEQLPVVELKGYTDPVDSVLFTPDGRKIIAVLRDRTVKIWDLETGAFLRTLEGRAGKNNSVFIAPDSRKIIMVSDDHIAQIRDIDTGALLHTLEGHKAAGPAAFTSDSRKVVMLSADNATKIWDLETGALLHTLEGQQSKMAFFSFTPDGRKVVGISYEYTAKIWDLGTEALLRTLKSRVGYIRHIPITSDSGKVAIVSGRHNESVQIWGLETGTLLHTLESIYGVKDISITPDGTKVVVADSRTIRIWDLETGMLLRTLRDNRGADRRDVSITSDSKKGIVVSNSRAAEIWDLETGTLLYGLNGTLIHAPDAKSVIMVLEGNSAAAWTVPSADHSAVARPVPVVTRTEYLGDFDIYDRALGSLQQAVPPELLDAWAIGQIKAMASNLKSSGLVENDALKALVASVSNIVPGEKQPPHPWGLGWLLNRWRPPYNRKQIFDTRMDGLARLHAMHYQKPGSRPNVISYSNSDSGTSYDRDMNWNGIYWNGLVEKILRRHPGASGVLYRKGGSDYNNDSGPFDYGATSESFSSTAHFLMKASRPTVSHEELTDKTRPGDFEFMLTPGISVHYVRASHFSAGKDILRGPEAEIGYIVFFNGEKYQQQEMSLSLKPGGAAFFEDSSSDSNRHFDEEAAFLRERLFRLNGLPLTEVYERIGAKQISRERLDFFKSDRAASRLAVLKRLGSLLMREFSFKPKQSKRPLLSALERKDLARLKKMTMAHELLLFGVFAVFAGAVYFKPDLFWPEKPVPAPPVKAKAASAWVNVNPMAWFSTNALANPHTTRAGIFDSWAAWVKAPVGKHEGKKIDEFHHYEVTAFWLGRRNKPVLREDLSEGYNSFNGVILAQDKLIFKEGGINSIEFTDEPGGRKGPGRVTVSILGESFEKPGFHLLGLIEKQTPWRTPEYLFVVTDSFFTSLPQHHHRYFVSREVLAKKDFIYRSIWPAERAPSRLSSPGGTGKLEVSLPEAAPPAVLDRVYGHTDLEIDAIASQNRQALEALTLELADAFTDAELAREFPMLFGDTALRFKVEKDAVSRTAGLVMIDGNRTVVIVRPVADWRGRLAALRGGMRTHVQDIDRGLVTLYNVAALKTDMQAGPAGASTERLPIAHEFPVSSLARVGDLSAFKAHTGLVLADFVRLGRQRKGDKDIICLAAGRLSPAQKNVLEELVGAANQNGRKRFYVGDTDQIIAQTGFSGMTAFYVDADRADVRALGSTGVMLSVSGFEDAVRYNAPLGVYRAGCIVEAVGRVASRHMHPNGIDSTTVTLEELETAIRLIQGAPGINAQTYKDMFFGKLAGSRLRAASHFLPLLGRFDLARLIQASRMAFQIARAA